MFGLSQAAGEMVMGLGSIAIAVLFVVLLVRMQRPYNASSSAPDAAAQSKGTPQAEGPPVGEP